MRYCYSDPGIERSSESRERPAGGNDAGFGDVRLPSLPRGAVVRLLARPGCCARAVTLRVLPVTDAQPSRGPYVGVRDCNLVQHRPQQGPRLEDGRGEAASEPQEGEPGEGARVAFVVRRQDEADGEDGEEADVGAGERGGTGRAIRWARRGGVRVGSHHLRAVVGVELPGCGRAHAGGLQDAREARARAAHRGAGRSRRRARQGADRIGALPIGTRSVTVRK